MAKVGFIGLGNMGLPMARNLVKAGHDVTGFDVVSSAVESLSKDGGKAATSAADVVGDADVVVSMLPAGSHVRSVYLGEDGILQVAGRDTLFIDCSTIDVDSARVVIAGAADLGIDMIDAPVSGGVAGAEGATLTFMVGGEEKAVTRATPILENMGQKIVHAGGPGNGQAAKICNNMILGISMIGVCEAFVLAEKLGLDHQALFDISSAASGQCWSLTSYCPVPGPVPNAPSNRGYQPGFSVAMMLKDLRLAQAAAQANDAATPMGAQAASIYALFEAAGNAGVDFSGIIKMLRGKE